MTGLSIDLQVPLGPDRVLPVRLTAELGTVVAVLGPNGTGKTSLLRAVAGLLPAAGTVQVAGREAAGLGPEHRGVGWVPQQAQLFPHRDLLANVAYPLRARGGRRGPARAAAADWLGRVGLADLAGRRPHQLSGGQAQRALLARALAADPPLLLLDEPFAALDTQARDEVRLLLGHCLAGRPTVTLLVTHDPVDVLVLADRAVVLDQAGVVQQGSVADLAAAPRSAWAGRLFGLNAWVGTVTTSGLAVDGGGHLTAADLLAEGSRAVAVASPGAVALHRTPPEGSPRNVWSGRVVGTHPAGDRVRVTLATTPPVVAEVTATAFALLHARPESTLWASLKATEVRLVPV